MERFPQYYTRDKINNPRAKDTNGKVQPDKHDENYATYVINHPLPIEVIVADR
jgi:hypothetical protein